MFLLSLYRLGLRPISGTIRNSGDGFYRLDIETTEFCKEAQRRSLRAIAPLPESFSLALQNQGQTRGKLGRLPGGNESQLLVR